MDADYANDIALLAYTSTQSESLLHTMEWKADSIGLHVNADKTNFMCFNQVGDIIIPNVRALPWKQRLIYRKWYQHVTSEGFHSYQ